MLGRALGAACAAAFVITGCGPDPDIVEASGELEAALAESERLGLPLTAAQLSGEAPPDSENAAAGLMEPLAKWINDRKKAPHEEKFEEPRPAELAALDDPMLDYAAPLLARSGWHIERDYVAGPSLLLPEFAQLKSLAKAFMWRARERSKAGDLEGAVSDITASGRLARHTASEPFLIGTLVSIAIDSIAGTMALDAAEVFAGDPAALRRIAESQDQTAYDASLAAALQGEFYLGANTVRNLHQYGGMKALDAMTGVADEMPQPPPREVLNDTDIPKDVSQRAAMTRHLQFWNGVFGEEDQAMTQVKARLEAEEKRVLASERPSEKLLKALMPVFTQSGVAVVRQNVLQDMRRATVLAAAFRAEKGRWPKDLAEIGVEIKNPLSGDPVGYAAEGDRITLWTPEPGKEDKGAVFEVKPGEQRDAWRIIWPNPQRG